MCGWVGGWVDGCLSVGVSVLTCGSACASACMCLLKHCSLKVKNVFSSESFYIDM